MKRELLVVVCAACGGSKSAEPTTPAPAPAAEPAPALISPDQAEEVQRMFARKANAVSRCLTSAIDNKDLPRTARGRVTLDVTIAPSGKPSSVKVIKATLDSKIVTDCVVERVHEIVFPELPAPYTTTYSYAFEAM